jgi:hypothetical protein
LLLQSGVKLPNAIPHAFHNPRQGLLNAINDRDAKEMRATKRIDDANKPLDPTFPLYYPQSQEKATSN